MTDSDLWEVRRLHGGLSLELRGGESRDGMSTKPALVIVQGSDRVRVELADVKTVVAAMAMRRPTWPRCWRRRGVSCLISFGSW